MLNSDTQHINQQWLDAVKTPLILISMDGQIELLNQAALELSGLDLEDIHGKILCETYLLPELCDYLKANHQATPQDFPMVHRQTIKIDKTLQQITWTTSVINAVGNGTEYLLASGVFDSMASTAVDRYTSQISVNSYYDIIQQTPNGIQIVDSQGRIIDVNRAYEAMAGLDRSNIIGQYIWDIQYQLTPAEDQSPALRNSLREQALDVLKRGKALDYDFNIIRPDGSQYLLRTIIFPLNDLLCILSIDMSVYHQMETALKESEQRYQLLVKNLPTIGIMLYDHQLRFTVVDGKALAKMGIDAAKLLGRKLTDVMPEMRARASEPFYRAALKGHAMDFEYQYGDHTFELHTVPVRDHSNAITGGMMIAIDVTQRKYAEVAARNSEKRYRLLIDSMQEGLLMTGESGEIIYVNDKLLHITGYDRADFMGKNILRFFDRDDRQIIEQQLRALRRGESTIYEQPFVHKNGEQRYGIVAATPLTDDRGFFRGAFAVLTDITEHKATEDALRQSNAELDAFAHTVAHDLKNPLSTAQGFANLLLEIFTELPEDDIKEYLNHIKQSNDRMMNIIDELLLLSEMRYAEVATTPLDMGPLVEGAIQRLTYMVEQNQPTFEIHDTNLWAASVGYPAWVEEIWTNYISNAIKYGGQPAEIVIGSDEQTKTGQIRYWVQDNGPGVPEDKRDKLFIAFNRFDKIRAEGHGLGLSIVKRISNRLGGDVGYEYLEGIGSRFYFTLPRYEG